MRIGHDLVARNSKNDGSQIAKTQRLPTANNEVPTGSEKFPKSRCSKSDNTSIERLTIGDGMFGGFGCEWINRSLRRTINFKGTNQ